MFGSIRKNELMENYLWLMEKTWFIFKDCFPLNIFLENNFISHQAK